MPYTAVWEPPPEPFEKYGARWHWDRRLVAEQCRLVRTSLEEFVNRNLAQLDQMMRSVIDRARAKISLREVPHSTSEHAARNKGETCEEREAPCKCKPRR